MSSPSSEKKYFSPFYDIVHSKVLSSKKSRRIRIETVEKSIERLKPEELESIIEMTIVYCAVRDIPVNSVLVEGYKYLELSSADNELLKYVLTGCEFIEHQRSKR